MEKQEMLLVSVCVITYNSSKTVLETLESIKAQTYPNIELIVSDDCSKDNTVELCREWVEKNKDRFVRTEILTIEKNTGVAANCNRGNVACQGEWIKGIAGDDILMPSCIQECMDYVTAHPDTIYLFSMVKPFCGDGAERKEVSIPINYNFFSMSVEEQYNYLIFVRNEIPAPTAFYNKSAVAQLGLHYDERIPMMEDWPQWVNLLKKGVRFHFIDKELVMYRQSEASISTSSVRSRAFNESLALFYLYYQHDEIWKKDKPRAIASYIFAKVTLTKKWYWRMLQIMVASLVKLKKSIKK